MTADQLRAALKSAGLTQRDLAARIGVTNETVNRWATERHAVPRYVAAYLGALPTSVSDYRGESILRYSLMAQACHCCGEPALIRVVRANPEPPPGVPPGDIVTYYCAGHAPIELLPIVTSWTDILSTWPRPEVRCKKKA